MVEKACEKCKLIVKGDICPICKESKLTTNWKGSVMVINPEKSEIAKRMEVTMPGKYAIRIGK